MAALSILLFFMIPIAGLFILPMKVNLGKTEFSNFAIKRGCWIIGLFLLVMTSGVVASIASDAGYVTSEIFRMTWLFGWAGVVGLIWMTMSTLSGALKLWKVQQSEQRSGQ